MTVGGGDILLDVQDLAVSVDRLAGRLDLYQHLTFRLQAGQVIAVTGENGAGKSTLGRVLTGLHRPPVRVVAGRVMFGGRDLLHLPERVLADLRRTAIRFVLQEGVSALDPVETVGWQLESVLRAQGVAGKTDRMTRIRSLLDTLGLSDPRLLDATAAELSGGQGKRIVIAQALLTEPKVVIADEVTAGLDLIRAREVIDILVASAKSRGCSIVLISHDPVTVARVASQVIRLERPALDIRSA